MARSAEPARAALAWLATCFAASSAHAHPGPAEAPDFGAPECISVVDKRSTQRMMLDYLVGFDDVQQEPDHIPVPDQKTHQFFAFRGQLSAEEPDYALAPFDPSYNGPLRLPLWLSKADLESSTAANTPNIAPDFHPQDIGDDVLRERADLAGQWLEVAPMRVPITQRQALLGLRWDLADVPAGVYQVAAYIYSPPYNAWEPRPGVIKVVDGQRDVPAITLDSVDASLFEGQGRKITGCVDAPDGSELRAYARATDAQQDAAWQQWASAPVDGSGRFELCYRSPQPGYSGIMQLRVVAVSPAGDQTAAFAPDQLVLIPSPASCTSSAKLCCPERAGGTQAVPEAPVAGSQAVQAAAPEAPVQAGSGSPAQPAATGAAPAPPTADEDADAKGGSGCAAAPTPQGAAGSRLALLLLSVLLAYRRGRRHARACRRPKPFSNLNRRTAALKVTLTHLNSALARGTLRCQRGLASRCANACSSVSSPSARAAPDHCVVPARRTSCLRMTL